MKWLICIVLGHLAAADIKLAGQLFQIKDETIVGNAKLRWSLVDGASTYKVQRTCDGSQTTTIGELNGNYMDDYGLAVNVACTYTVSALDASGTEIEQSEEVDLVPFEPDLSRLSSYDNAPSAPNSILSARSVSPSFTALVRRQNVEYRYNYQAFSNGSFSHFGEQTRTDGWVTYSTSLYYELTDYVSILGPVVYLSSSSL